MSFSHFQLTCALASGVPIVTPEFFIDVISIDSQYPEEKRLELTYRALKEKTLNL